MTYEYKYLKYKVKYNELKKNIQIGADNNTERKINNIFNEFVNSFLILLYLETECCYNDLHTLSENNNNNDNQKIYILIVKDELSNYRKRQEELFRNILRGYNKNLYGMNMSDVFKYYKAIVKKINLENLQNYLKNIIEPLIKNITDNYKKMINNIYKRVEGKKIPHYKIKYVKDLNRTNKNCLKIDDNEKCCDLTVNASNCIDYIVNTRITRASYLLDELYDLLPNIYVNEKIIILEIRIIVEDLIENNLNESKNIEKENKKFKPGILNKLINKKSEYGEIEFIPIINKK